MKIENNHAHAITYYGPTNFNCFIGLFISALKTKINRYLSLTAHFPLEIQHPKIFKNKAMGMAYIQFGEFLKSILHIKLYWENSPLLEYGTWKLKHGELDWENIPDKVELCFDTGHLMLGAKDIDEAQKRILMFSKNYGTRIKHLHIHENNLISDDHKQPQKIITKKILATIIRGRTYIFEK
jgi:hypothetical protein